MNTKKIIALIVFSCLTFYTFSQDLTKIKFTKQDSLRGSITPERIWWDLTYYHLDIVVNPEKRTIKGSNEIKYTVIDSGSKMQIDLQKPLKLIKAEQDGRKLKIIKDGNAHFIELKSKQIKGSSKTLKVYYEGSPREAVRAPWDGGISWEKDKNGNHFIASSCQGLGASVWWPNKDHMYDEVDSMLISVNVPKNLINVSNGRLVKIDEKLNSKTFHWAVKNPINNYGVNINIGDYVNYSEIYNGEKGNLDVDYYVLSYNLEKAKVHFKDNTKMIEAFEHWFGPYPFYEDSYKLVQTPYLGMEHQSSITYGNKFLKGYLGRYLSNTGWGLKFDYIIIHEGGHEWFANNITYKDIADMWIHESFTTYSESLFLDYYYGPKASSEYIVGIRKNIRNDKKIIGTYNVNNKGSNDMYPKGANFIHTLRQLANDDEKWRQILRGLNKTFYHQTVTTKEIEDYISQNIGIDLSPIFNQYLRDTRIPILEYGYDGETLKYKWSNIVPKFKMPIEIIIDNQKIWIYPESEWKYKSLKFENIKIDQNYYVNTKKLY